jgi:hypothetical protein
MYSAGRPGGAPTHGDARASIWVRRPVPSLPTGASSSSFHEGPAQDVRQTRPIQWVRRTVASCRAHDRGSTRRSWQDCYPLARNRRASIGAVGQPPTLSAYYRSKVATRNFERRIGRRLEGDSIPMLAPDGAIDQGRAVLNSGSRDDLRDSFQVALPRPAESPRAAI